MSLAPAPCMLPSLGLLLAESRILAAVAGNDVLHGTASDPMNQLAIGPDVFRAALHDLVAGGWIYATTAEDGRLTVGRDRRTRDVGPPGRQERRRRASCWEGIEAALDA